MRLKPSWAAGLTAVLLSAQAAGQTPASVGVSEEDWDILSSVAHAAVLTEQAVEARDQVELLSAQGMKLIWTERIRMAYRQPIGTVEFVGNLTENRTELARARASYAPRRDAAYESQYAATQALEAVLRDRHEHEWSVVRLAWNRVETAEVTVSDARGRAADSLEVVQAALEAMGDRLPEVRDVEQAQPFVNRMATAMKVSIQAEHDYAKAWNELLAALVEATVPAPEQRGAVLEATLRAVRITPPSR